MTYWRQVAVNIACAAAWIGSAAVFHQVTGLDGVKWVGAATMAVGLGVICWNFLPVRRFAAAPVVGGAALVVGFLAVFHH
jgi:hypothetical protein